MDPNNSPRRAVWRRVGLIILCVLLALILAAILFATTYIHHLLSLVTGGDNSSIHETLTSEQLASLASDPDYDPNNTLPTIHPSDVPEHTVSSEPIGELQREGIINILLVGEDRKSGQKRQRSDSMILCSFNTNTNSIDMISFLRDTYVAIPGHDANKMNAAYQFGGVSLLDQTMALNFGVHVDANIVVNFNGFKSIIDMLGGVDISLTSEEANHLNSLYNWGLSAGMQHLDGEQALAYSRIRKIDWDINRTQRQRNVLIGLINTFKSKDITSITQIASNILQSGFIQTDMSADEVRGYILKLFPMLASASITNQHIPALDTFHEMSIGSLTYCKVPDLEANRQILKKIFGAD